MSLKSLRIDFEREKRIFESAKLRFLGVEGFDVYNPSIPFRWHGSQYIFGRVERRNERTRSWVRLFKSETKDIWRLVQDSMIYQLEDPCVSFIHGQLVLEGTHVFLRGRGRPPTYYAYFYKGVELDDLCYFTSGPNFMKDIRLVEMSDGRIGVFSRPRSDELKKRLGVESQIGFVIIDTLDDLDAELIERAPYIEGVFDDGEWGGCNQLYLLDSGLIGIIGHKCYRELGSHGVDVSVYMNVAFVFDPCARKMKDMRIIGTRNCYPAGPAKGPDLTDCAFSSGIAMRPDGKVDLYSGIGDVEAGRIVIDYPFAGYGEIVEPCRMETTTP
jgi:hypothetical protein